MSKTRKRKLLKEIGSLRYELAKTEWEYKSTNELLETYKKRFRLAGSEIKTIDGPAGKIQTIEAEAQAWGQYAVTYDCEIIDECRDRLIRKIAEGLAENNIVQFIIRDQEQYNPVGGITVGAKLFVIPWEEMKTGVKTLRIVREIEANEEANE